MHRSSHAALAHFLFALTLLPLAAGAQTPPAAVPPPTPPPAAKPYVIPPLRAERIQKILAPGVELIQEIVPGDAPEGPLTVTAILVDRRQKGVRVEAALGYDQVWKDNPSQGRERVATLAQRHGAVAALNAGFFTFSSGHPIGLHVQDGDLVTEPALNRSALVLTDDDSRIAAFTFAGEVSVNGAKHALNGLNRKAGAGTELLLFTPRFGEKTLPVPGRVEVALEVPAGPVVPGKPLAGKVLQIGEGGATPLRPGVVVLSGGGAAAEFLRANAIVAADLTVTLDIRTVDNAPFPVTEIRHAIAGSPRILTGGRVTLRLREEGVGVSFSTTRHPRTAAGITGDGRLVFLTVDGRQSGLSRGVSLEETARWLMKFGAVDGVNLDGGGSTTLALRGSVANSPSGGAERAVANMFVVHAADGADPGDAAARYSLTGGTGAPLSVGTAVQFTLSGPKPELIKRVAWGVSGGIGFVSQSGRFVAYRAGSGRVVATLPGSVVVSVPVTVLGIPKPPDLLPPGAPKPPPSAGVGR